MTDKEHREFCKKLGYELATKVGNHLTILGVEAALLVNYGLTVSYDTLKVIYSDYKKLLTNDKR
jgi:hypothetical protein